MEVVVHDLWRELAPYVVSLVTGVGGWVAGRRGRKAAAVKTEADAAESLSVTVATLGQQMQELYTLLRATESRATAAESRASAAEFRASAAETRASAAESEVVHLRAEVARLRAELVRQTEPSA